MNWNINYYIIQFWLTSITVWLPFYEEKVQLCKNPFEPVNASIVEEVKVITECGVASGIPAKMIWTQHSFRKVAFIIQAVFFYQIAETIGSGFSSHLGDSGCQRSSPCGTVNLRFQDNLSCFWLSVINATPNSPRDDIYLLSVLLTATVTRFSSTKVKSCPT